jgi:hypothetical protein
MFLEQFGCQINVLLMKHIRGKFTSQCKTLHILGEMSYRFRRA